MDGNGISALTNYTMEEFLLRTKATLGAEPQASRIHGVLGGEAVDVACMASTLGYAYFLSQRDAGDCVCVPILNQRRSEARVPDETVAFLERQRVSWSALLWRDDMDLRQLHAEGKLSLTLLSTAVLNTLEDGALASCVVRVINCSEQQGGGEEASSTAMVAREILQEAPEQLTAPLAGLLRDALLVESAKTPSKDGHPPSDQEELLRALERVLHEDTPRSEVELRDFTGAGLDQVLLKDLKELSDGDIKVSISTVSLDLEAYSTCPSVIGDLKSFCDRHGYEGLVLVSSSLDDLYPQCHQVAVYSGNKDILNQICCELEESRSWSLDLEPLACLVDVVQLYQQQNTSIYVEQIVALVKEFLDRRQCLFIPNSRTSSTEGVAGSAPLSQGSSGITDMYSSDAEPPIAMENVPEASGPQQAFGELAAELVSPDSGLATVRSSRSSKESSVFLSDDSPVAETTGFLQNPALSFPSLCAAAAAAAGRATADRRPSARNKSDNFDLFSFDPLHSSSTSPAADGADEPSRSTEERASSSLSEFGELSLVDFYTGSSDGQVGSEGNFSPRLEQLLGDSMDARIPATPMNSLVEGSPLSSGLPKFFPEDVVEKINEMGNKESVSSSEPWDDFASDTKGSTSDDANVWSLTETGYIGEESPDIDLDKQAEVKDTGQTGKEGGGGADEDSFLLGMGESLSIKMPVTTSRRTPLTPETSKEDSWQSKDGSSESDFWSYSARRGFLTATATPYPDSLDMWNTTIQEDSQSTLSTPDATDFSERSDSLRAPPRGQASLDSPLENLRGDMGMWNTTIREVSTDTSPEGKGQASSAESWAESLSPVRQIIREIERSAAVS
ncbi:hypothetical protein MATL_G00063610 [Megalops atlanticus]|uniref:DHHA2 domain-containing protein n=1 Tax=Megalops atlanticus TaxID=7932 RepID=A0A9D3THN1_MEGAT|nr:hypothetical protein MATL_G00063610 [Megalops atlanticus]